MQLTLKNIGKIGSATVKLEGITVIAGENNSGKSTVGKALYSLFNSFYRLDEKILDERQKNVERLIIGFYRTHDKDFFLEELEVLLTKLKINSGKYDKDFELLKKEIENSIIQYKNLEKALYEDDLKKLMDKLELTYKIPDENIFTNLLNRNLKAEFNGQICNEYTQEEGHIELIIRSEKFKVSLLENKIHGFSKGEFNFNTEVIYIDDPFVLDNARNNYLPYRSMHRSSLQSKLFNINEEPNVISEIVIEEKLNHVFAKINSVCNGEMVKNDSAYSGFGYKKLGTDATIDIRNISTGMKTFVILKTLLQKGCLEENGTIILDEPEIHLHPEWQVLFAELIVLIQKEFNMHVLINTHSPYFLDAIDVYSKRHKMMDKCNYYLASNHGEKAMIEDVTANLEPIYSKLARPLQNLENIRYSND